MKVTLEFSLPDEQVEFDMSVKSGAAHAVLDDMREYLRRLSKYESDRVKKMKPLDLLEEIRNHFYETLSDHDIKT